jgi:sigma-E factor negative regulatory protein RseC
MAQLLSTNARVASVHEGMAEVRLASASACGSCGAQSVCGTGRERSVFIPVSSGVCAGDSVRLQMSAAELNIGAMLAYLLPALTTLCGGLLLAGGGDGLAALGATLGLGLGLLSLRLLARTRLKTRLQIHPSDLPDLPQGETP